jgi:phosphoribosylanthranilate isomerase
LSVQNATDAVVRVRPWAVDISSGVEAAKGIKDAGKIAAFIGAVRNGDATVQDVIQNEMQSENQHAPLFQGSA